jgi:hypothetical protein
LRITHVVDVTVQVCLFQVLDLVEQYDFLIASLLSDLLEGLLEIIVDYLNLLLVVSSLFLVHDFLPQLREGVVSPLVGMSVLQGEDLGSHFQRRVAAGSELVLSYLGEHESLHVFLEQEVHVQVEHWRDLCQLESGILVLSFTQLLIVPVVVQVNLAHHA